MAVKVLVDKEIGEDAARERGCLRSYSNPVHLVKRPSLTDASPQL